MKTLLTIALLLIVSCTASQPIAGRDVIDKFVAAGIGISNLQSIDINDDSPVPSTYTEHWKFTIDEIAPKGGQIFVCETKDKCDLVYEYYKALAFIGGPHHYQSGNGLVVAQLNNNTPEETAQKFKAVLGGIR